MASQLTNLFDDPKMAAGYARWRPDLHPRILERARSHLKLAKPVETAVDVGCGAGLSTRALQPMAQNCIGIDPSPEMVRQAAAVAPEATFLVGSAETLPLGSASVDLIAAAGSLNFVDLNRFFAEAARVLRPNGQVIIYDFAEGRRFRGSPRLATWYAEFLCRYPSPEGFGQEISPETLPGQCKGFHLHGHEYFDLGLRLSPEFYLEYVLTETNVADAIRQGTAELEIRTWCAETLAPVFEGANQEEVMFPGYIAYLAASSRAPGAF